jgi:inositol-pentakisphosphate 2-kinase
MFPLIARASTSLSSIPDKLLRLRKDLPTTAPCAVAQESWLRLIAPLIDKDQLVVQELVEIPPGFINNLNEELREWERSKRSVRLMELRPAKRHGTYLADDKHGLLVTDMSNHGITVTADQRPLDESDLGFECEEVVQFKPKWLAQSPSAPENARRCRTCALRARSNSERVLLGKSVE